MGGLSIWHWLVTALVLASIVLVIYGIYRYAKRTRTDTDGENRLVGVGGWLLLLVVGLLFLGPLMGAANISSGFLSAETQYPNLKALDTWSTFKEATWWSYLVVVCVSFYAGIGLAASRNFSVVRRAKIVLWIVGPVAAVVLGMFIPLIVFGRIQSDPQFFGGLIGSSITAAIWTAYLSISKRVRATYRAAPTPGST